MRGTPYSNDDFNKHPKLTFKWDANLSILIFNMFKGVLKEGLPNSLSNWSVEHVEFGANFFEWQLHNMCHVQSIFPMLPKYGTLLQPITDVI